MRVNMDHAVEDQQALDSQPREVWEQDRKREQLTSNRAASVARPLQRSTGERLIASRNLCQSQEAVARSV